MVFLKIYVINVDEATEANLAKKLISNGFDILVFEKITNMLGLAAISGDSILIIGDEYELEDQDTLCRKMTAVSNNPTVFITHKQATNTEQAVEINTALTLNAATDYIEDLLVFLKSKRKLKVKKFQIGRGDLSLNFDSRLFSIMKINIYLTNTEFNIMHYILASENMNISHEELMLVFQAKRKKININTLANHIRNINKIIFFSF